MHYSRNFVSAIVLTLFVFASPALAESTSFFLKKYNEFNSATMSAKSIESLYPLMSQGTQKGFKALTPQDRKQVLQMLQMGTAMGAGMKMKVVEKKIGAKVATLKLKSETQKTKEKGGTSSTSMSADVKFLKEGSDWKIDFQEQLQRMGKRRAK